MPDPAVTQGEPSANPEEQQLPEGQASELNAGLDQAAQLADQSAAPAESAPQAAPAAGEAAPAEEQMPMPEQVAPPSPMPGPSAPMDQLLFGADDNPGTGNPALQGNNAPPGAHSWLPALQEAAMDPHASEEFKNLYRLVLYHMGA